MTTILGLSGSLRRASFNSGILRAASELAPSGITVLQGTIREVPLYDADLEAAQGLPEGALRFKALLREHDALLIASPEYNGFFTPLLKNALDWGSRPEPGQTSPYAGKLAVLLAASPGALGGVRGLPALRVLLSNLGVVVLPGQMALGRADAAFSDDGTLREARQQQALAVLVDDLLAWSRRGA